MTTTPLLSVENLRVSFTARKQRGPNALKRDRSHAVLRAVDGVDFTIVPGSTLGLVGESGCGKSTLARAILRLIPVTHGTVRFGDVDVLSAPRAALKRIRAKLQIVFQDTAGSLNPRTTVATSIAEPLVVHGVASHRAAGRNAGVRAHRRQRIAELMDRVGLDRDIANRYPHELSGGQRQRVCIARALALDPELVICDEAVSALDVCVQAQVLNLLRDLQLRLGMAYLFISHDLAVVKHISDRVAVMYLGRIVEFADAADIYARPRHPYTLALLAAIPQPDPTQRLPLAVPSGEPPSPLNPPAGCAYHPRCPLATDRCRQETPALRSLDGAPVNHTVACHHAEDVSAP